MKALAGTVPNGIAHYLYLALADWDGIGAPLPKLEVIKADDYERMADFSLRYQVRRLRNRHQSRDQILARIHLDRR